MIFEEIFNSATKIVFLAITGALIAGLFCNIVEAKDFMMLASMTFAFYFGQKINILPTQEDINKVS